MRRIVLLVLAVVTAQVAMAATTIPAPFRGNWVDVTAKQGCKAVLPDDDVGYVIDSKTLMQYEQVCTLKSPKVSTATLLEGTFSCNEEGEVYKAPFTLKLSPDGKFLLVNDRKLQRCK